jgi:hypothetical protein
MKKYLFLVWLVFTTISVNAQKKFALLIGINKYSSPENGKSCSSFLKRRIIDLDGPLNDVEAIETFIKSKFSFGTGQILRLINEQASRVAIIDNLKLLAEKSQKDDIVFIYYAGHGSQIANSLSSESDKKDETIVPADAWKEGVKDIRDKELAILFNNLLDKGVKLTVLLDCCHSGSIQRGPSLYTAKKRFAMEDSKDIKDPNQPPSPESKQNASFLIMTAAQDNQLAAERLVNNISQGVFTYSFITATSQLSPDASAQMIFESMRSIIKSNGESQEPSFTSTQKMQDKAMFGLSSAEIPDKTQITISQINGSRVALQGGYSSGIYPQSQLTRIEQADTIILTVDTVYGLNKSIAKITRGKAELLKSGQFFELTNWVAPNSPLLKIYIPESNLSYENVLSYSKLSEKLQTGEAGLKKIGTYAEKSIENYIFYDNGRYYLNNSKGTRIINCDYNTIATHIKPNSSFYMELPPSKILVEEIKAIIEKNNSLKLVSSVAEADYVLFGIPVEGGIPSFGLRIISSNAENLLNSLPAFTKTFEMNDNSSATSLSVADGIYKTALKLAKLKGWIQLPPPPNMNRYLPFHLELWDTAGTKKMDMPEVTIGNWAAVSLVVNDNYRSSETQFTPLFIYLFSVDKNGRMRLHFPDMRKGNNCASDINRVSKEWILQKNRMLIKYNVTKPAGTDNFFLLATDQPFSNCKAMLNQDGIAQLITKGDVKDALTRLFNLGNEGYNARDVFSSEKWGLLKISVLAKE